MLEVQFGNHSKITIYIMSVKTTTLPTFLDLHNSPKIRINF